MNNYLRSFNGFESRIIFVFWFGDFRAMSGNRIVALNAIFQRVEMPVCLISDANIMQWQHPDYPFHPAINYLSEVHKSDYFRAYFMRHYGGGYTDIKPPAHSWVNFFSTLDKSDSWGLGYTELRPTGVAVLPGQLGQELKDNYTSLIGMCSYILRKHTPLTERYLSCIELKLDSKLELLKQHPATQPYENFVRPGEVNKSLYPIKWTEICGECLHPAIYEYKDKLLHEDLICPLASAYR